jgi:hypothetical protein
MPPSIFCSAHAVFVDGLAYGDWNRNEAIALGSSRTRNTTSILPPRRKNVKL